MFILNGKILPVKSNNKLLNHLAKIVAVIFILMNIIAIFHSYKFTHFSDKDLQRTASADALSTSGKLKALLFGVDNPRPVNIEYPKAYYQTVFLRSNKEIECWYIENSQAKGTVIIFHGYCSKKSTKLDKAALYEKHGYNVLLVDFMGSGGSEGNQTTIGYYEAQQVKTAYDYIKSKGEKNIILSGSSMGAVAIMKAIYDHSLKPQKIILECPFGSMYKTVCARFRSMGIPVFPMAGLLVFWGGVQNKFWAFGHNPTKYAEKVKASVLLLYGAKDDKVSREEIDEIYTNLSGPKKIRVYPNAGHENYLKKYSREWERDVFQFVEND